eukprot:11757337-Heterocapsa_arctica.AAC.1
MKAQGLPPLPQRRMDRRWQRHGPGGSATGGKARARASAVDRPWWVDLRPCMSLEFLLCSSARPGVEVVMR